MNETIQQVLSDMESIKTSLGILVNKGVSIKDELAPIFSTAFGGWVTIQLFKRQEKMRIKEDLRLSFFREYKEIYKELLEKTSKLYNDINLMKNTYKSSKNILYIKEPYTIENKKIWNIDTQVSIYKDEIKLSMKIFEIFGKLEKYMYINKMINRYQQDPYFEIYKGLGKITIEFNNINTSHKIINLEDEWGLMEEEKMKEMKEHNESVDKILEFDTKLEGIVEDMESIHEQIEREFIGNYFKPKWYQWKKKKEYKIVK